MRRFGRQGRGQGKGFVTLVRQTEPQLLATGPPVVGLARVAQEGVQGAAPLTEDQQGRLATQLTGALAAHHQIAAQSRQLTHGKTLAHCKIVNAYAPPMAPICKGKSNCPTQFGRKPGIVAEPATGFIFALPLPVGNPRASRSVVPLIDKVQHALGQVASRPPLALHSLAGDLALNDSKLPDTLPGRGLLTVGIPHTVEPLTPAPTQEEIRRMLHEAGLHQQHPPHQGQLACASGSSRPVVESIIASLLGRGAARITYKGQRGPIVQIGMVGMAHNAATVKRIDQDRLSKRAQKFRRLLRLKRQNVNEFNVPKN